MTEDKKRKAKSGGFAIFISMVAMVISIAAIMRTTNQGQLQQKMGDLKGRAAKDLATTRDFWDQKMSDLSTQIELLAAKSNLLKARMYLKLNNDYEKAAREIQDAKARVAKAKTTASDKLRDAIGTVEIGLDAAAAELNEKSQLAHAQVEELWKNLSNMTGSAGEKAN